MHGILETLAEQVQTNNRITNWKSRDLLPAQRTPVEQLKNIWFKKQKEYKYKLQVHEAHLNLSCLTKCDVSKICNYG